MEQLHEALGTEAKEHEQRDGVSDVASTMDDDRTMDEFGEVDSDDDVALLAAAKRVAKKLKRTRQ